MKNKVIVKSEYNRISFITFDYNTNLFLEKIMDIEFDRINIEFKSFKFNDLLFYHDIDIKRDKENKFQINLNDKNYKVLTTKQSEKLYARLNDGLKERNSLMKKQWGKITAYIDRCD